MKPSMNRIKFALATVAVGGALALGVAGIAPAQTLSTAGPKWTPKGELVLPADFHAWVFLGAPLTPHALNDGKAGFPEYHNVYVHPKHLAVYRKTGTWPEGTVLLKELQLTRTGTNADGSTVEASGRGYFPAALNGVDISVKDSQRFKETNGWGFFNFGHHAPPYAKTAAVLPGADCASCHAANADHMVFSKFYAPILMGK